MFHAPQDFFLSAPQGHRSRSCSTPPRTSSFLPLRVTRAARVPCPPGLLPFSPSGSPEPLVFHAPQDFFLSPPQGHQSRSCSTPLRTSSFLPLRVTGATRVPRPPPPPGLLHFSPSGSPEPLVFHAPLRTSSFLPLRVTGAARVPRPSGLLHFSLSGSPEPLVFHAPPPPGLLHFSPSGSPEPLVFHVPQDFFISPPQGHRSRSCSTPPPPQDFFISPPQGHRSRSCSTPLRTSSFLPLRVTGAARIPRPSRLLPFCPSGSPELLVFHAPLRTSSFLPLRITGAARVPRPPQDFFLSPPQGHRSRSCSTPPSGLLHFSP